MPNTQARAWWADVEHLKEDLERRADPRDADRDDLARRRAARERRREELEAARDQTRPAMLDAVPRRRFARAEDAPAGRPHGDAVRVRDLPRESDVRYDLAAHDDLAGAAPRERRTVQITGRTVPAPATTSARAAAAASASHGGAPERRRPARRPAERIGARPDRVALWALLMCLMLILVAVGTADAATATEALSTR